MRNGIKTETEVIILCAHKKKQNKYQFHQDSRFFERFLLFAPVDNKTKSQEHLVFPRQQSFLS